MSDLIDRQALKNKLKRWDGNDPYEFVEIAFWAVDNAPTIDAAAAIEALQAEAQFYKALADEWQASAENKERLLGLYRAEQAKHFYSATDNNGRVIQNPCACMNIPVFPDSSEIPNS